MAPAAPQPGQPVPIDIKAKMPGYFPAGWKLEDANPQRRDDATGKIKLGGDPCWTEEQISASREATGQLKEAEFLVKDARALHTGGVTFENARRVFQEKGFTILPHESGVKDWSEEYIQGMLLPWGNDIGNIYAPEIEEIIRNVLLPEYHIVKVDTLPGVLKRGPGSKNNFYGTGVHQDYAMTTEDYIDSTSAFDSHGYLVDKWKKLYEQEEVLGFMVINFWRPINMVKPLEKLPLGCLDPNTVSHEDLVFSGIDTTFVHGSGKISNQMALRYNAKHQWYYYSKMTNDEVLIFKQFEHWKGEPDGGIGPKYWGDLPVRSVFHSAFADPTTPDNAPPRTSTEYRVPVFLGKKKTEEEMKEYSPIKLARHGCGISGFERCSVM